MAASEAHSHMGGEPTERFLWVGVPTGDLLGCRAALRVCKSKSICLDASYGKQSQVTIKRKVKIDVTDV